MGERYGTAHPAKPTFTIRPSADRWRQLAGMTQSLNRLVQANAALDAQTLHGHDAKLALRTAIEYERQLASMEVAIDRQVSALTVERLDASLRATKKKRERDAIPA